MEREIFVVFSHGCIFETNNGVFMENPNVNGVEVYSLSKEGEECLTQWDASLLDRLNNLHTTNNIDDFRNHQKSTYIEGVLNMHAHDLSSHGAGLVFSTKSGIYTLKYVMEHLNTFFDIEDDDKSLRTFFARNVDEMKPLLEESYEGSLFPTKKSVLSLFQNALEDFKFTNSIDDNEKIDIKMFYEFFSDTFHKNYKFLIGDLLTMPMLKDSFLIKMACSTECPRPYESYATSANRVRNFKGGKRRSRRRSTSTKRKNHVKRHTRRHLR